MCDASHTIEGQTSGALDPSTALPLTLDNTQDLVYDIGVNLIGGGQAKPPEAAQDLPDVVGVGVIPGYALHVGCEAGVDAGEHGFMIRQDLTQAIKGLLFELF